MRNQLAYSQIIYKTEKVSLEVFYHKFIAGGGKDEFLGTSCTF